MLTYASNIYGIRTFAAFLYIENHFVVSFDLIDQTFGVNKSFCRGIIMLDKTKTFLFIKELYSSCDLCAHF